MMRTASQEGQSISLPLDHLNRDKEHVVVVVEAHAYEVQPIAALLTNFLIMEN